MSDKAPLTREQLEQLPRLAVVALAARCARRVQPLFAASWPEVTRNDAEGVAAAIVAAERVASGERNATSARSAHAARAAGRAAADASARAAARGADAAADAAAAARAAARAAHTPEALLADTGAYAAGAAARAAADAADIRRYIDADYELLRESAEREGWHDKTPVPPEFFGPLWPQGEPEWYRQALARGAQNVIRSSGEAGEAPTASTDPPAEPSDPSGDATLDIEIEIPQGSSMAQVVAELKKLASLADDLDRALGGNGLKIRKVDVFPGAGIPAEAPR